MWSGPLSNNRIITHTNFSIYHICLSSCLLKFLFIYYYLLPVSIYTWVYIYINLCTFAFPYFCVYLLHSSRLFPCVLSNAAFESWKVSINKSKYLLIKRTTVIILTSIISKQKQMYNIVVCLLRITLLH